MQALRERARHKGRFGGGDGGEDGEGSDDGGDGTGHRGERSSWHMLESLSCVSEGEW